MSQDLYNYGSLDTVQFALVNSTGGSVTGHTIVAADIKLYKDGTLYGNIGTECVEMAGGVYIWTPTVAAETQCEIITILISDSVGTAFIDNKIIMTTGGHASARFSG